MRKHIVVAALLAGTTAFAASAAHAAMLQIEVFDGATLIGSSPISSTGALSFTASDANFGLVSVTTTGVPLVPNPDMGTINISVSANGPAALRVLATQWDLVPPLPGGTATTTMTYNALIGSPGPVTETMAMDPGDGAFSESSPLATHVFDPAGGPVQTYAFAAAFVPPAGLFSETQEFSASFTAPNQELAASIQFNVPEPASLAVLGAGLIGLAATRQRRRQWSLLSR